MPTREKPVPSHVVKVTGMSEDLLALLDARVRQQHAAGRAEYVRELIRRDVLSVGSGRGEPSLDEYHALVDLEMDGRSSSAQESRLREVQQALEDADREDPKTATILARLEETAGKLDRLLEAIRELPRAGVGG